MDLEADQAWSRNPQPTSEKREEEDGPSGTVAPLCSVAGLPLTPQRGEGCTSCCPSPLGTSHPRESCLAQIGPSEHIVIIPNGESVPPVSVCLVPAGLLSRRQPRPCGAPARSPASGSGTAAPRAAAVPGLRLQVCGLLVLLFALGTKRAF